LNGSGVKIILLVKWATGVQIYSTYQTKSLLNYLRNTKMKLTESQLAHVYELALQNFQKGCYDCEKLKQRMEKHLGEKKVKAIKQIIKKNPYEK